MRSGRSELLAFFFAIYEMRHWREDWQWKKVKWREWRKIQWIWVLGLFLLVAAIDDDMPLAVVLTPTIKGVEVKFWDGAGVAKKGCYLQLPKPVGITIHAEVVVFAAGTLKFVQNVKRNGTRINNDAGRKECLNLAQKGRWMIDGVDPYGGKTKDVTGPGNWSFDAKDSPGQCLSDPKLETIDLDETFRTFLMWKAKPRKNKKMTKGAKDWNVIGCVEWS